LKFEAKPRCANQSDAGGAEKCQQPATTGHIYCTKCRIANGGYNRYNPPANLVFNQER
jgi:hypothetical protein